MPATGNITEKISHRTASRCRSRSTLISASATTATTTKMTLGVFFPFSFYPSVKTPLFDRNTCPNQTASMGLSGSIFDVQSVHLGVLDFERSVKPIGFAAKCCFFFSNFSTRYPATIFEREIFLLDQVEAWEWGETYFGYDFLNDWKKKKRLKNGKIYCFFSVFSQ